MAKKSHHKSIDFPKGYLIEIAWEVCNQVGGIYTVIRSKAPAMVEHAQGRYCMIGPYVNKSIQAELEPLNDSQDVFGLAAAALRKKGYDVNYAQWLITGRPHVVLLNPVIEAQALNVVKYLLWKNHGISTPPDNAMIDQIIAFNYLTKLFFDELVKITGDDLPILAHF